MFGVYVLDKARGGPFMKPLLFALTLAAAVVYSFPASAGEAADLLPDVFFAPDQMADNEIDTTEIPGRVLFRFSTAIPNFGLGEYRIESTGEDAGDGLKAVVQRVFQDDGGSHTRPAGTFRYDPTTQMMDAPFWARYRIREILPNNGVGPVVRAGGKPQVRITSSALFNGNLPNVPTPGSQFFANGGNHGISVGYADLYPKFLRMQWIDITGIAAGTYWLEVEVDGDNSILESDETNNITRIKVDLPDAPGGVGEGEGEGLLCAVGPTHTADTDASGDISLSEVLRLVQFFNARGYGCEAGTEDGFAPLGANRDCCRHDSDYTPDGVAWFIDLAELLRCIQFFNSGGYHACNGTEDGYCPGAP